MVTMADQDKGITLLGKLDRLHMDLGDQGTGGINHSQTALFAGAANFGRNPMRGINHALAVRDLFDRINENGAFALQFLYDEAVVDDLLANIDWRPKGFERDAHDIDGTNHPGAEPTGLQQKQTFLALRHVFSCVLLRIHVSYWTVS